MEMVTPHKDTIAAVATGGVLAAIGIVRVSGDAALNILDRIFLPADGRRLSDHPDRQLVYGTLLDKEGETLDVCLCTVSRAPHSYTGENTGELQCHGSPVVLRMALESLFAHGARQALAGEFTRRAFLNGTMDLTRAEAVIDLIDAETPLGARNAAMQLTGSVYRIAERVYDSLTDICSHFHAVLDYPDEEIPPFALSAYAETLQTGLDALERLLSTFHRGELLDKGVPTALTGKPNVGKSSLLNALLGYDRAIVTAVPGTTRDTLSERCILGQVPLRLTDTAGVRDTGDEIEALGVERTREAVASARLTVAVFDRSRPWEPEDDQVVELAQKSPVRIAVLNKADLPAAWEADALPGKWDAVCTLSARDGTGLPLLEQAVERAFPLPQSAVGEILTNARQAEAIGRAADCLRSAVAALNAGITPDAVLTECEGALSAIAELTGRAVREDVTDKIFARFCVGK